jgi:hypothetical protein
LEVSVAQQIDLILAASVKPNQELVDIVNSFHPSPITIWKPIDAIISKYQIIAIEFEIKEIIKRKHSKQDKFTALLNKVKQYNY